MILVRFYHILFASLLCAPYYHIHTVIFAKYSSSCINVIFTLVMKSCHKYPIYNVISQTYAAAWLFTVKITYFGTYGLEIQSEEEVQKQNLPTNKRKQNILKKMTIVTK